MNLDRVTITGADNSIHPKMLLPLTQAYPFVEWGILVSRKMTNNGGAARFPSEQWIDDLRLAALGTQMQLSLHLCGEWLRDLLRGLDEIPDWLFDGFDRVQLNFHGETLQVDIDRFCDRLADLGTREIIFQIDGNMGQQLIADVEGMGQPIKESTRLGAFSAVPLFDMSHGAGVLPGEWPEPFSNDTYHGYAGGLGPENLAEQIPLIGKAAGDCRFWIDMETRVRSDGDRHFDLAKVEQCLKIAEPFVQSHG